MSNKRKIEIFSAGCKICKDAIELANKITCPSCEISVLNMKEKEVVARAKRLGVNRIPAIVINGKIAECCCSTGISEETLKKN